jgi:hypothetical protein
MKENSNTKEGNKLDTISKYINKYGNTNKGRQGTRVEW